MILRRVRIKIVFRVVAAVIAGAWAQCLFAGGETASTEPAAAVDREMLAWLPEDTETLCVVTKPSVINDRLIRNGGGLDSGAGRLIDTLFKGRSALQKLVPIFTAHFGQRQCARWLRARAVSKCVGTG